MRVKDSPRHRTAVAKLGGFVTYIRDWFGWGRGRGPIAKAAMHAHLSIKHGLSSNAAPAAKAILSTRSTKAVPSTNAGLCTNAAPSTNAGPSGRGATKAEESERRTRGLMRSDRRRREARRRRAVQAACLRQGRVFAPSSDRPVSWTGRAKLSSAAAESRFAKRASISAKRPG